MKYQLYCAGDSKTPNAAFYINENSGMTSFLFDPANTDYQAYLAWVAEGNLPRPVDFVEPSQASVTPIPADEIK